MRKSPAQRVAQAQTQLEPTLGQELETPLALLRKAAEAGTGPWIR